MTIGDLVRDDQPQKLVAQTRGQAICHLDELLEYSLHSLQPSQLHMTEHPYLLAPVDVQAIKACGVTFTASLLERAVEEKAMGDTTQAANIRHRLQQSVGMALGAVVPGSAEAQALKLALMAQDLWSPYLEVGIGPDAEVFTKSQPMSAVGLGAEVGVLSTSQWNNPEPEIVLLVSPAGQPVGATLGNDVNLRDYEGRSALLLGKAKDQNGSCAIGPLVRLFDDTFSLEDVAIEEVALTIVGTDGYCSSGINRMSEITRDPNALIAQVCNGSHQYPDGFALMLGTMFVPSEDRGQTGSGFTHKIGDRVEIASSKLGKLVNWVNYCHEIPEWRYGLTDLIAFVSAAHLAGRVSAP